MKMRWWVLGWIAAVAAGVGLAHWWAPKVVLVPASAQPEDMVPLPVPPIQAAAAPALEA
ncbi:hypothetical protein [Rubrivivax benzoatilyticus]|uniref:Uncharacterized protein n=1 Tax=Rubrivivax benzoatilyticus TaxID=316997 RepID=A0ABX0HTN3_9BURK|nr:hypothetical protein [Rubrivivax benzoatilyticus]EGJ11514.1 hypothetical protein RBXJA2T_14341 [Rubrivivax benzoatilyticus JA2 = ATCC BAA-35]NHK97122.1 hypothetical protein [Rubrivivax benzoatilyticus]NHL23183.1 hypothetical protein [Rubrivivax benzoatilyticus]